MFGSCGERGGHSRPLRRLAEGTRSLSVVRRAARAVALIAAALLAAAVLAVSPGPLGAQACPPQKTALVLPGGGALGIAHVGLLQVLDSLGIVPDLVVGTSMGAVTGALYASGYSGKEIESLVRRFNVGPLIGTYAPRAPRSIGQDVPLVSWEQADSSSFSLQTSAVREGEVNARISALLLRGNLLARGNFDSLPIPFRAVATDLQSGNRVVLGTGDLAQAARASFAIPLVFKPIVLDGVALIDGGLVENVPVRTARELGATRVILSQLDASHPLADPSSASSVALKLVDYLFTANLPVLAPGDVVVNHDVSGFSNLDFADSAITAMIQRGRRADLQLANIACLPRGARRDVAMPPLASTLIADPRRGGLRQVVLNSLRLVPGAVPDVPALQARFVELGATELVRAFWLRPQRRGDSIVFSPWLERAPRRALAAGLAYDSDLGGRGWVGGSDRTLLGRELEGAARARIGVFRRDVSVGLRPSYQPAGQSMRPYISATLGSEDVRLFDSLGIETPRDLQPTVSEQLVEAGVERTVGRVWTMRVGAGYRHWRTSRAADLARVRQDAVGVLLRLDRDAAPGTLGLAVEGDVNTDYQRAAIVATRSRAWRMVRETTTLRLGIASRDSPLTERFTLGGTDGFAGYHIGERLGLSEAVFQSDVGVVLRGPLQAFLTVMGGQTSDEARRPISGDWIGGVRVGVGADSPVGSLRVQWGVNTERRRLWFLRLGRWG